jgi:hypothetical protein
VQLDVVEAFGFGCTCSLGHSFGIFVAKESRVEWYRHVPSATKIAIGQHSGGFPGEIPERNVDCADRMRGRAA